MRERLGKSGSLIDFQQQIGDPRERELLIEIEHEILGPFGRVGPQLVDVQLALLQRLAAVRGRLSLCADQAAAAKWWLSMPMASVSAEGDRKSTRLNSSH